ncbi:MAG: class I SAM-dependent methyltransferase [Candidatus Paceibacterota bacterium]
MQEAKPNGANNHYNTGEYAKLYLDRTLSSPYTINKSRLLASVASKLGTLSVLDFGSNIHGSIKAEGSLRFQMSKKGINYAGVDLSLDYFDKNFFKTQGVPEEKIYPEINGIVGDILKSPIKSNSAQMVICCDVLEHVSDPIGALKEIYRIMQPEGVALVVLPSFYKLDMADFSYIKNKRKSSHFKKKTTSWWMLACENNGLMIDESNSAPVGIASGLSYLVWMDERFVPERQDLSSVETYSPQSSLHKKAKNIFSKYDEFIDIKIQSSGFSQTLLNALNQGNIKKVFQILNEIALKVVSDQNERQVLHKFFDEVAVVSYKPERVAVIKNIFMNSRFPHFLLGNSVLLVLKKKK